MSASHHAWLRAMGIDTWVAREPEVTQVAEAVPQQDIVPPVSPDEVTAEQPAAPVAEPVKNPVVPDNWPELLKAIQNCNKCGLASAQAVPGAGLQTASLFIIADELEQATAEPANQLLTAMLRAIGLERRDVYITSLLKCRPGNRADVADESYQACSPYLQQQLKLVSPDLVLVLGVNNAQRLLNSKSNLSRLRGQLHYLDELDIPVRVSFDPAYLLKSPVEKRKAWEDLKQVRREIKS